jgi:hypothetical protein
MTLQFGVQKACSVATVAVLAALTLPAAAAPLTMTNATTSVTVNGGETVNSSHLVDYDGYFRYTDLATSEETSWSIDPVLIGPGASPTVTVLSNGSAGGLGSPTGPVGGPATSSTTTQGVSVTAVTELVGRNAKSTFTFAVSAGTLDGFTFLYYAENDLFGFDDDAAAFTGSIGGGDLALFQYDTSAGGLTVKVTSGALANAALALFGAELWSGWGAELETGDLSSLSADGSTFVTLGDLGLALAFTLTGTSATVVVNYETVAEVPPEIQIPEPVSAAGLGLGLLGLAALRRRVRR